MIIIVNVFFLLRISGQICDRSTDNNQPLGLVEPHHATGEKSLIKIQINVGLSKSAGVPSRSRTCRPPANVGCSNFRYTKDQSNSSSERQQWKK